MEIHLSHNAAAFEQPKDNEIKKEKEK